MSTEPPRIPRELFKDLLGGIMENKSALVGALIVCAFVITAITIPIASLIGIQVTPYDPLQQDVGPVLGPPSLAHPLGTDMVGRDLLSRIVAATPNDLAVSLAVIGFSFLVGAIVGSFAALRGGLLDEGLMRLTDIFFAIPALVLAMAIGIALGPGIVNMTMALMMIWWPPYARLARGEALKISHQNFIEAARLSGLTRFGILLRHVLPNLAITMMAYASLDVGAVILVYSGLSYVGLSVKPPSPDWGQMVSAGQDYLLTAPWLPLLPGLVIALGVVGFSLVGDAVRDALESS
jgi:peptide/nickel transport system permease protein